MTLFSASQRELPLSGQSGQEIQSFSEIAENAVFSLCKEGEKQKSLFPQALYFVMNSDITLPSDWQEKRLAFSMMTGWIGSL
jgi:hypothetical protein